jgi:hypothetical protein
VIAVGGMINVALWPIFTHLHGPTSYNRSDELFGLDALSWGALMEGPSGILIALGLAGSHRLLTARAGRVARWGFWLATAGLAVASVVTIAVRAPVPPLHMPVVGMGLILLAAANRRARALPELLSSLLFALGATQLCAFTWALAVRPDLIDRIDGYRIYGLVASVLWGSLWIAFGAGLLRRARSPSTEPKPWAQ